MIRAVFFDTHVPLYLLSGDLFKANRAEAVLAEGGTTSVQVLGEFVAVARRRQAVPWPALEETLAALRKVCRIEPLTVAVHDKAMTLARRHGLPIHEASIAASALLCGATTLFSEDFRHGQRFEGLTVVDPFRSRP